MENSIDIVYFSPTKTTQKVVEAIALGIGAEKTTHYNLTLKSQETKELQGDLVVIGVPVYRGRIPEVAVDRLRKLKGNLTPAIVVAVYGNRDYDDALVEVQDIAIECGLSPVAGAAFIGEHSFSSDQFPIAQNRPDAVDLIKAKEFGETIRSIIANGNLPEGAISLPGNRPYKEVPPMPEVGPITNTAKCDQCGICVSVCPTEAIQINNEVAETDIKACIVCCACVKTCPNDARINENDLVKNGREKLFKNCSVRKEPELFVIKEFLN